MVSCPAMARQLLADGAAALWCLRGHIWRGIAATSRLAGLCGPMMLFVTVLDGLRSALMRQLGPCFGSWLAFGDRCLISMGHFRWLSIQIVEVMLSFGRVGTPLASAGLVSVTKTYYWSLWALRFSVLHTKRTIRLHFAHEGSPFPTQNALRLHFAHEGSPSCDSPFVCVRNAQSGTKRTIRLHFAHEGSPSYAKCIPILRCCIQNAQSACTLRMEEALPTQNALRFSVFACRTHNPPARSSCTLHIQEALSMLSAFRISNLGTSWMCR